MRRLIASLLGVAAVTFAPSPAAAEGCPPAFHLHTLGEHNHEHGAHRHVGLGMDKVDRNGNGLVCVKQVTPDANVHVHVDDLRR